MSKPTLKTCSKITSLKIERAWLNTKNGYWYTTWEGKPKALHRILTETYLPNPSDLSDVHHINGDRNDNRLENLEWCTRSHNIWHSYNTHGRKPAHTGKFNEDNHNSIKVVATNIKDGSKLEFPSMHEAGRQGFLISKVCLCVNGKRNTHKGYTWEKVT